MKKRQILSTILLIVMLVSKSEAQCISKSCILDMIRMINPPPILTALAHDNGTGQGGGVFALTSAKKRGIDYINVFPSSVKDSVWANIVDTVYGYNPLRCGAVQSKTVRSMYTAQESMMLYGYVIPIGTLMDEVAFQHCAIMQQETKMSVIVSAGDYYFEHRINMPKVDKGYNGLNQYYWQGYGARLNFINCDGMYRMPDNVKQSEDLEARNSTIIRGFTFNMTKGSAIKFGGGFQGDIRNCLFNGGDTCVWVAHWMSGNISSNNFNSYLIGIYVGNLSEFIPDTLGGRIRGANSKGGSNGVTCDDNHFRPRKDGTSLAAVMNIASSDFICRNTSQDGAPTIVKFIVYVDTKNLSVDKGASVDGIHGEAQIASDGAAVYCSGGGAAWFTVSHLFIQTPTTGAMVWCNGGRNGSGINCSDYTYTVNRNHRSTGAVKWKFTYAYGTQQPVKWIASSPIPTGANLVQLFK